MSILSDAKIIEKIYDHELIIEPFVLENIQPSSVDLTLSRKIKIPKKYDGVIDVYKEKNIEQYFEEKEINDYVLEPDTFIIGQINETIGFSKNLQGNIQNRNSVIRAGIDVGLSTFINPGYTGKLPIVIKNIGRLNIQLVAGMRICQLVINEVKPEARQGYHQKGDAKYHLEEDIQLSKIYLDKEFTEFLSTKGKEKFNIDELSTYLLDRLEKKSIDIRRELTDEQKREVGLL
ncbi:MAG: dCTP deaminase [Syntrophomonadaceae bacterium]|nr:dCTP deaminase [Syntrophomonadaceae bacterium]